MIFDNKKVEIKMSNVIEYDFFKDQIPLGIDGWYSNGWQIQASLTKYICPDTGEGYIAEEYDLQIPEDWKAVVRFRVGDHETQRRIIYRYFTDMNEFCKWVDDGIMKRGYNVKGLLSQIKIRGDENDEIFGKYLEKSGHMEDVIKDLK